MTDPLKNAMTSAEVTRSLREKNRQPEAGPAGNMRVSLRTELRVADRLYDEAVSYAHGFMDDVRQGKPFDFHDATPVVRDFIQSVFRNENAAAAICKLKAFDEYTYTHCINVSVLSVILGRKLGHSEDRLLDLGIAGMFHDVGKSLIPSAILNKPGRLTDSEMNEMRTHPLRGYELLRQQQGIPESVLRACLEHHERYDGSGYPRALRGEDIHDFSRIVAVVDVYDALTSRRVYKEPLAPGKVLAMMYKWRLSDFHPNIVEHFIRSLGVYPVGSFVRLDDGRHAVVVDHNPAAPLRPIVRVAFDRNLRPIPRILLNLGDSQSAGNAIADVINPSDHDIDVYRLIN